jgi:hypothetical protein
MEGVKEILEGLRQLKDSMKENGLTEIEIKKIVGPVEEYIAEVLLTAGMSSK